MDKFYRKLTIYHIDFLPRIFVKSLAIVDFLVELLVNEPNFPSSSVDKDEPNNKHGSGLGPILTYPTMKQSIKLLLLA